MACGSDDFCGGGVSRPGVEDSTVGQQFIDILGKADTRTQELFNMIQPLLAQAGGGVQELLTTGGIGTQIPAIQAAIGSSRSALNASTRQAQEQSSRAGITGTDYARLVADQTRQGEQQIAGIAPGYAQQVFQALVQALTGTQGQAVQSQQGALSAAGGVTQAGIQPIRGATIASYAPQVAGSGPTGG